MDFDEYEYLEKAVDNPDSAKEEKAEHGNGTRTEEGRNRSGSSRRRSDEAEREAERGSKRSRMESNRDRHHPPRDGERQRNRDWSTREHRDRDREERNGKEREREREREKEKGRNRGKEDRPRDRNIERGREKEMERSRRSSSRPERHYEEERHQQTEKNREMEFREKGRERPFRERDRDARRYKEKKEDIAEPEVDPERDQRTVFAYQIGLKADERDVYEFFSRAGKVRDVRLIMDRNSRRSKGVGYIEFYDVMSVPLAIALSGQLLLGQPVMVKPSEAEKNLVQSTTGAGTGSGGARKLYVGNLHYNITEDQLRQVFEPFGSVELVQLPLDPESGHCKGYGFIQFARLEDARAAQSLNGQLEIAGKAIKVSAVTDQVGMQDAGVNATDLDDDEGGGLSLNAHSRALLMRKLDRSDTTTSVTGALTASVVSASLPISSASILGAPSMVAPLLQAASALNGLPTSGLPVTPIVPTIETAGVPSECLLLKNMFDPNLETQSDFDLDIKDDVQDECSKFGALKHIFVDKNSAGLVYLRFDNVTSASNAQRALHGRWFAGKMITATYMLPQHYEAKFPNNS